MELEGIINQDLIDKAVAETAIDNSSADSGYDPDMFLKILMTQLENQNPFDSVDTSEIMQQQAMLTQVEQSARQTQFLEEIKDNTAMQNDNMQATLVEIRDLLDEIKAQGETQ